MTAPSFLDVLEEINEEVVEPVATGIDATGKDIGIERHFRDACVAVVTAPTSDALRDFIGRALSGLPRFG